MFLYIQFFGLIALMPLEPSTSLTDALCRSTFALSLSLICRFTTHNTRVACHHKTPSLVSKRMDFPADKYLYRLAALWKRKISAPNGHDILKHTA